MAILREIVFDCRHPAALARFWAAALEDYEVRPYDAEEIARLAALGLTPETDPVVMVDGPGPILCFQIGEAGSGRNRLHLDLTTEDRQAEVGRLVELGARHVRDADGFVVLEDPEGNRFCLQGRA